MPGQKKIQIFLIYFNLSLLLALTIFGTHFSKYQLVGPIYLHDALLALGALASLLFVKKQFPYWPILAILCISGIYLGYSFYHFDIGTEIIIRQFAIFGYLGCYYLLNRNDQPNYFKIIKQFLIGIAVLSIILQTIYVGSIVIDGDFNPADFNNHYWYSHMVIAGVIVGSALVLLFIDNVFLKLGFWSFIFMLGWATGHASAQLSILLILVAYTVLRLKAWLKMIPIVLGIFITIILINKAPQFKDKNTDWRLLTWGYLLNDLAVNKYGLIGNGFGAPYTNSELEMYLFEKISSTALQERGRPDERYISPPHNSFITMFFAIGIVPALLIFVPYLNLLKYVKKEFDSDQKFSYLIMLSLVGLTVWCSFNVVLELPHSAGFFWLVYFTFWKFHSESPPDPDSLGHTRS